MTEQEKELVEIFDSLGCEVWGGTSLDLAKAIIQKYPQITKKPVNIKKLNGALKLGDANSHESEVIVFRNDQESQQWIDSHWCEVVG